MGLPARLRYPLLVGMLLAASIAGAVALRYVPLFVTIIDRDAQPVTATPQRAYAFARAQLALFGGLPPDAVSTADYEGERVRGGGLRYPIVQAYWFTWYPREPLGTTDRITIGIYQHRDGTLYANAIFRQWRPAFVRRLEQWWMRRHARAVPVPTVVRSTCASGYDLAALRRVLGNTMWYEPVYWPSALRPHLERGGVEVRWDTPTALALRGRDEDVTTFTARARGAWVNDELERRRDGGRVVGIRIERGLVRVDAGTPFVWAQFASPDMERVCR